MFIETTWPVILLVIFLVTIAGVMGAPSSSDKAAFKKAQQQWIAQVKARGSVYMQLVEDRTDIYKAMYLANNTYFFVTLQYLPEKGTFVEIESDIISDEARMMLGQTMKFVTHI